MNTVSRKKCYEISFIRPILILLLVIYHAFIIYRGGWKEPQAYVPNQIYYWIATIAYSFMLEMFVFISGYVWAYSIFDRNRSQSFGDLVLSKIKRLIIPSIIFSILYIFLFKEWKQESPMLLLYDIINGVGHMWFLPMLFWCFIFSYLLYRTNINDTQKLILLLLVSIFSFVSLPLQLTNTLYYLFFFYAGFLCKKNCWMEKLRVNRTIVFSCWMTFVIIFVILTLLSNKLNLMNIENNLILKALVFVSVRIGRVIYASLGIFSMFVTALLYTKHFTLPQWYIKLGSYCFGIYLFQQFILQIIYYKTSLPSIVGAYWLPWIGFFVTLFLSYLLTKLSLNTTVGRRLM